MYLYCHYHRSIHVSSHCQWEKLTRPLIYSNRKLQVKREQASGVQCEGRKACLMKEPIEERRKETVPEP